jgi:hypothetical protein
VKGRFFSALFSLFSALNLYVMISAIHDGRAGLAAWSAVLLVVSVILMIATIVGDD